MRKTFFDLMNGHKSAEIRCLYTGKVVRRLTVDGASVLFDAMTCSILVPLAAEIKYEPWCMDRGSLFFSLPELIDMAKLCTEYDVIKYDDGTEASVAP